MSLSFLILVIQRESCSSCNVLIDRKRARLIQYNCVHTLATCFTSPGAGQALLGGNLREEWCLPSWFSVVALAVKGTRKTQENQSIAIQVTVMFLPEKKIVHLFLYFLISTLVCRGLEYFQHETATIWLQKTEFFPLKRYSTSCESGYSFSPSTSLHCCLSLCIDAISIERTIVHCKKNKIKEDH